jgi:hypothetical protein
MAKPWERPQDIPQEPAAKPEFGPWNRFQAPKPDPDMSATRAFFEQNLKAAQTPKDGTAGATEGASPKAPPKPADEFLEYLQAGWQMSLAPLPGSLLTRGEAPDVVLPENAPMFARIASQLSTLAGDFPAMVAGAVAGGAMAPAAAPISAPAGAFALPAGARQLLMDHYEKGDIKDFGDFWERASAVFWETVKGGAVGAATGGAGALAGKAVGAAASPLVKGTAVATSEIATMVTVGKVLEGEVPHAQDFIDAAVLVGGLHGAGRVAGKIRSVYTKTGVKPAEVLEAAKKDPLVMQDLLADNVDVPKAFEQPGSSEPAGPKIDPKLLETSSVVHEAGPPPSIKVKPAEPVKVVLKEEPSRSPEVTAVLSRIAPSKAKENPLTFDKAYTAMVDDLHPLKQLTEWLNGGEPMSIKNDPYSLARLYRGSYGKADQFLELSPFEFESLKNTGSKPLKKILEPIKDDLDAFRAYAVAARAAELAERGIETGVPLEEAKATVANGKGRYGKAFQELVNFQNDTLKYLKDSGILSDEAYSNMLEANRNYIPFHRLMSEEKPVGGGRGLAVRNPVKKIKGSERQIVDPIESIIKNTYTYISLAERNRVLKSVVEVAEQSKFGEDFIQKVKNPNRPIEVGPKELGEFLEEHGLDPNGTETLTIFRPQSQPLAETEFAVYRNGKREVYNTTPEIARALKVMDAQTADTFMKILSKPAKFLRGGAVLTPDFAVRNVLRDQLSALNLSQNGYIPVYDMALGLGAIFKKDEHYQNWLKSGGANAAMVAIDRNYIQENVFKLNEKTGLIDSAWNVVKSPIELMRVTSELLENATRMGEFKRATGSKSSPEALMKGALGSREVTLDFARMGYYGRAVNMITAFWNAQVQGVDRVARAFKENPAGMTAKTLASITTPSILLWMANKDDKRYQDLPNWQKDLFWIVLTDKHIYRIPKPFELGIIFGSGAERLLEAYYRENPEAFKDFGITVASGLSPSYIPTFAVPIIEQFANKSTFTGAPIVPHDAEKLLPAYRYSEHTSETAKQLVKLVSKVPVVGKTYGKSSFASPAVIENYVRGWSGSLGMYALDLADKGLKTAGVTKPVEGPTPTLADIPFIKAFVIRYPSGNAQPIIDFYEKFEEHEAYINTVKHFAKQGNVKAIEDELKIADNQHLLFSLRERKEALSNMSRFIKTVNANPSFSPADKRQLIDGVYASMIDVAKSGNKMTMELEKSLKR